MNMIYDISDIIPTIWVSRAECASGPIDLFLSTAFYKYTNSHWFRLNPATHSDAKRPPC